MAKLVAVNPEAKRDETLYYLELAAPEPGKRYAPGEKPPKTYLTDTAGAPAQFTLAEGHRRLYQADYSKPQAKAATAEPAAQPAASGKAKGAGK